MSRGARCLAIGALVLTAACAPGSQRSTGSSVRVAGIVLKWIRGDKEANWRRAEPMIRRAAAGGARLVVTTECFLDGYAIEATSMPLDAYRALGEPVPDGPYCLRLSALARELRIHLVAGMLESDGDARYNTAVLIGPDGRFIGKYRKMFLEQESVRNTPGEATPVFETPWGHMGIIICADRRVPRIARVFRREGAEFLVVPSGGIYGPRRNDPIVQARSRDNGLPIVFVHPVEFMVTDSNGEILSRSLLGNRLHVEPGEVDGPADGKDVFYYDLPAPSVNLGPSGRSLPTPRPRRAPGEDR